MFLFGLAEVVTAFRHNFFGVRTAEVLSARYAGAAVGVLYSASGLLVLTMKKSAVTLALIFLVAVIFGRIAMVVTGLYPTDSLEQTFAIALGTSIVIAFAIYIALRWKEFR